jgi:hypothetical protein
VSKRRFAASPFRRQRSPDEDKTKQHGTLFAS